jgi:hypothetical protein
MFRINKHSLVLKVVIVIASFAFASVGFSASVNSARIIPNGRVSIIENGKVVGEFSKEAPLPEGSLLKCEAECAVKMNDAYLVAEPDTVFSVSPMANSNELLVQEGTVYFSVTESSRPIQFNTPGGVVTTRETSLTGSELKGYVRVSGNETEIGVIEGGTMRVETTSGEMAIVPGKQITITLAEPATSVSGAGGEGGSSLVTDIALGVAGTAVIVGGIYALSQVDWDSSSDGSPSSP